MSIDFGMMGGNKLPDPIIGALSSVAAGLVITQFVLEAETGVAENLVMVGGPILVGGLVANYLTSYARTGPEYYGEYLQQGLIAGAAGAAALMIAGVLPVELSADVLSTVGLVGSSVIIGDLIADSIVLTKP